MSIPSDSDLPNAAEIYPQALSLIQQAIGLLDRAKAPADIAAHLDRAVHRISDLAGLL